MRGHGFEARALADSDIDKYDCLAQEYGSVFNTVAWTSLFGESLSRYGLYDAGGALRGGFCLFREERLGLTALTNPPGTPSIGPFLEPRAQHPVARLEERRDALKALADLLDHLHPAVVSISLAQWASDCLPFSWRHYKVIPRYTYLLGLEQTEEAILAGMSEARRRNVGKARKDGLRAELTDDHSTIATLVEATFARQGKDVKREYLKRILFGYANPANSYAYVVRAGEVPIAGAFVIHDARSAYYLFGGYRSEDKHNAAGALALFESIRHARELGLKVFDFEGSRIPAIERYFRGFGGRLTHSFRVSRAWLPIEMVLKIFKREQF